MGLATSQARYQALTARQSDLQLTGQQINQSRLDLANTTNNLFNSSTNLDPSSPDAVKIQLRIDAIQNLDKSLELQLRRVDTQNEAIQTELDSVKKLIDKSIDQVFKTFA